MARRQGIFRRLRRVLGLAEQLLAELAATPPAPQDFEEFSAFRWEPGRLRGRLVPVRAPLGFDLSDLLGVQSALDPLVRNTEQFLRGLPSNHVLLYGERGTGKSSAVRGLLTCFADKGLRLVEVQKQDLLHLPEILSALDGVEHRVLLFCDDLSFDAGEAGHRELKAALEGSIAGPGDRVRVVATSNRRHLMPERRSENTEVRVDEDGELHVGETIDEKLALSDRFGLQLGFFGFDQDTYLAIVQHHAAKAGITWGREGLRTEALRWALQRSSRSGRTARQFVDDLAGRIALEEAS